MTTNSLLSADMEKVLLMLEYRHSLLASRTDEISIFSDDLERVGLSIESFAAALHFMSREFSGIDVVHVYDFVNGENPTLEQLHGILPPVASVKITRDFKKIADEIRHSIEHGASSIPLDGSRVTYNNKTFTISVNEAQCILPPNTLESELCAAIFGVDPKHPISWDEVAEKMIGLESRVKDVGKQRRAIGNTIKRLNGRLRKTLGTSEDLVTRTRKTIQRNF